MTKRASSARDMQTSETQNLQYAGFGRLAYILCQTTLMFILLIDEYQNKKIYVCFLQ